MTLLQVELVQSSFKLVAPNLETAATMFYSSNWTLPYDPCSAGPLRSRHASWGIS
jgi:hypothetical protein